MSEGHVPFKWVITWSGIFLQLYFGCWGSFNMFRSTCRLMQLPMNFWTRIISSVIVQMTCWHFVCREVSIMWCSFLVGILNTNCYRKWIHRNNACNTLFNEIALVDDQFFRILTGFYARANDVYILVLPMSVLVCVFVCVRDMSPESVCVSTMMGCHRHAMLFPQKFCNSLQWL